MFIYLLELFVVGAVSASVFGFNDNAVIAISLYYSRKVVLTLVKNKFV